MPEHREGWAKWEGVCDLPAVCGVGGGQELGRDSHPGCPDGCKTTPTPNQAMLPHPPAHLSTALPSSRLSPKALCSPKQLGHPITSCLEPPAPHSLPQTRAPRLGQEPEQPLPAEGSPVGARGCTSRPVCRGTGAHCVRRRRSPQAAWEAASCSAPALTASSRGSQGGDVGPSRYGLRGCDPPELSPQGGKGAGDGGGWGRWWAAPTAW